MPIYTTSFHFSEYPFGKQGLGMEWGEEKDKDKDKDEEDEEDNDDDDEIASEANRWAR